MQAADFNLLDQNGKNHSLHDYRGKYVVLYFYPKDNTPGCTKEACGFRDHIKEFEAQNTVVLGISKDSIESHKKFAEAYHLPFPLLSDPEGETTKAYGAWGEKKFMGKTYEGIQRNTYVISPTGEIIKTFKNVSPFGHAQEVLQFIKMVQTS